MYWWVKRQGRVKNPDINFNIKSSESLFFHLRMEGAIDLDRCESPALRQVVRVRFWCWRASFWFDIFVFIATSFEPYHSSLSSVNISQKTVNSWPNLLDCTKMKNRDCTNRMTSTDMSNRARIYRLLVQWSKTTQNISAMKQNYTKY